MLDHYCGVVCDEFYRFSISNKEGVERVKEFYGSISLTARVHFSGLKAKSEEEAINKIMMAAGMSIDLLQPDNKTPVAEIDAIDWDFILEPSRGNVQESNVSEFEIYEEKSKTNISEV